MSSSSRVTVLVADDDEDLRALVAFTLRRAGFEVVTAHDGSSAIERVAGEEIGLALLDINMPRIDGFAVCAYIRHHARTPVIMLSARDGDADIVHALEIGADDYIKKPFSPATLIARVQALLRRSVAEEVTTIETDGALLDLERRSVEIGGERLSLTPLETEILRALFSHPGRLVAMEQLAAAAWGRAGSEERHALRQCVHRLRRKLEERTGIGTFLETVRGGGYRWVDHGATARARPEHVTVRRS